MLSTDTIIFPRAKTMIDLIWKNNYIEQWIIKCRISTHNHDSDHYSMKLILNLQSCSYESEAQQPYNYKNMNWKNLEQKLQNYLSNLKYPKTLTAKTMNKLTNDIDTIIQWPIQEIISRANICQFSKRWWNKDLMKLWKQAQWARQRLKKYEKQEDENLWKEQWWIFHREMNKCKWEIW